MFVRRAFTRALTLATVLSLLMSSVVFADTIQNNVVAGGNDTIAAGGSTTITYEVMVGGTGLDGQGGCNASDGTPLSLTISAPAGVTVTPATLSFTACSEKGQKTATFFSATGGSYAITHSFSDTGSGAYTNEADFTLTVNAATPSDTTAPTITPNVTGTLGFNDWYTSNVGLSWTVTDAQSAISSSTGCGPTSITADQAATTYTCSATSAGGTTTESVSIKRDVTAPVITDLGPTTLAGSGGWYTTSVTNQFSASDAMSGLASASPFTQSSGALEGSAVTIASGAVSDLAGNTNSGISSAEFQIDLTNPLITYVSQTAANAAGWNNTDVTVNWSCSDTGSGVVSPTASQALTTEAANQSATGTCTDNAGRIATHTVSGISIDKTAPVVTPASVANSTWRNIDLAQTFSASDAVSGLAVAADASFTLTASAESANGTTPTIDTKTVSDVAGNSTTRSVSALIDKTAPVITDERFVSGTVGDNGWYKSAVVNKFAASDALSGLASGVVTPFTQSSGTAEGSAVKISSGAVADAAGNSNSGIESVAYKIDLTNPTITFMSRTAANAAGWNKTAVTVTWSCSDGGSGVVNATVTETLTAEGANQSATGTCTDMAGRTATNTVSGISIDTIAPSVTPGDVTNTTWRNQPLSETFGATDAGSGLLNSGDTSFTLTAEDESTRVVGYLLPTVDSYDVYDVAGNKTTRFVSALIDLTAPIITDGGFVSGTAGTGGWYTSAVTNRFSASDALSGLASGVTSPFTVSSGTAEGSAVKVNSGSVADAAGNSNAGIDSAAFKIDLSNPTNIAFVGGPAADSSHYFGTVPAAPSCTAQDAVSGLKDCVVSGYSTAVGTHTLTATATDNAGRTATATRSYTVLAWTLNGFYQPVDMNVVNTVKGGSTVPLKFEIFTGSTELTSTSSIKSFTVTRTSCAANAATDDIEIYSTGGTSLRYDTTGGQFIQNWQVPKGAGVCYRVTMTALDGSTLVATFLTK